MKVQPEVPADTREKQDRVSDPAVSAWVSANAGSGKTTVLVRRVIRLLLDGNPPGKILCLTFTKAAAANMANKVLGTLSDWVKLDDAELDKKIGEVSPERPSSALRARARRLFAAALETPGGLKVQTIHAFCDRVLHQFPFEAKVPAGFEVLDDVREEDLLRRSRDAVMIEAANNPESKTGRALAVAVASATDDSFGKALNEAVRARRKLKHLSESNGLLASALGLEAGQTVDAVISEILHGKNLARSEWPNIAAALSVLGGNAKKCGERILKAFASLKDEAAAESYLTVFFTGEGELRVDSGFGSEKARDQAPDLFSRIFAERERLVSLREKLFAARALERTAALLTLASKTVARFEALKRSRGALDYTDLIEKTAALLTGRGSEWVLYKLDGGIDHVLVDEAQDTSPEQWEVIRKLTEEFFAGEGARGGRKRTVFAVGDDKQSIFSFQGAVPKQFDEMKDSFKLRVEQSGSEFRAVPLDLSFRSGQRVLDAVDKVFEKRELYSSLSSADPNRHVAVRSNAPALVEIWDTEKPGGSDDSDIPWHAPLNAISEKSPTVRLAQRIAEAVKEWTGGGLVIEDRKTRELRVPNAGDVIVLVRRRGPLFDAVLQALKSEGIPVAGADRLKLSEHIAAMDLAALGEALLLEQDDFSLACALKSPLFGFDDGDLFRLAHDRTGTLIGSLRERANEDARYAEAGARLDRWRQEALSLRPFDFYSRVLGRDRGREMMLARLGPEAADAIDEFLASALSYEILETPSLAGFLSFLRRAGTEVKRDLEVESAAVRVMTVHGAKGLEAPLVILADTTTIPDGRNTRLHDIHDTEAFVWAGRKDFDSEREQAARLAADQAREAEYRRLLYVALTRAADALIVCGAEGTRELEGGCWYRLVRDALEAEQPSQLVETDTKYGKVLRWRPQETAKAVHAKDIKAEPIRIPPELGRPAPASREGTKRERPSDYETEKSTEPAARKPEPRTNALKRGDLLHRLMQFIPEHAEADRPAKVAQFLRSAAPDFSEDEREKLGAEALKLISDPGMAALLGARSLPEVSFLARDTARNTEIAGRIDRLFEKDGEVIVVDYKTDANPPKTKEQVPERYQKQLRLYREAAGRIYPGRTVRTLLVYSAGPIVHELKS